MPVITMQSLPLTDEQKGTLAATFAHAVSEVTHVPEEMIYIFFNEHKLNDAAKGGKLFSVAPPKFGVGDFAANK